MLSPVSQLLPAGPWPGLPGWGPGLARLGARTPTLPRPRNKMKIINRGINLQFNIFCGESSLIKGEIVSELDVLPCWTPWHRRGGHACRL